MAEPPPPARPFLEFRPLFRALKIASDARKLALATLGLLALTAGWMGLGRAFGGAEIPFATFRPGWAIGDFPDPSSQGLGKAAMLMVEPFRLVVAPFAALFRRGEGPAPWLRTALMATWAVAAWGIFGGAIARVAAVQATTGRPVGLRTALRFAIRKAASLVGAPLTPMFVVAIFAAACAGFGLLYRIPRGVGATIAAWLGFVPLALGLVMALILVGLAVGWPLMMATVAVDGEDAPDALSRSYSYVNQRSARYAAHVAVAWAIGAIGLVLAGLFARAVVALADWGVALGAPDPLPSTELAETGRQMWALLVGGLVHAWIYSYFWSAATVIYLILRRDVDGTEWYDVYLPEHDADPFAAGPGPDAPAEAPAIAATPGSPAGLHP